MQIMTSPSKIITKLILLHMYDIQSTSQPSIFALLSLVYGVSDQEFNISRTIHLNKTVKIVIQHNTQIVGATTVL